jgi:Ras-related protein Rab-8A
MAASASNAKVALRILMLGDSGVGKSSLMKRFIEDKFSPSLTSTIGIDYEQKVVDIDGQMVKLTIWDTA